MLFENFSRNPKLEFIANLSLKVNYRLFSIEINMQIHKNFVSIFHLYDRYIEKIIR